MTFSNLNSSYGGKYADPKPLLPNVYIVPKDKSFGFDSLTHDVPYTTTHYFGINGAYPENCTTFQYRGCSQNTFTNTVTQTVDSLMRKNVSPSSYAPSFENNYPASTRPSY
jgi:hypothetical protein